MPIEINPNRLKISSGGAGRAGDRKRQQTGDSSIYRAPTRSDLNHIPAADSLMTLINSAVAALRAGVYWDRGTILNLVV